ncbi:MAG: trimethylamine methyltransferase family protein, partial [Pseudomonadota bacterium]|nr:trimethylamine methyltransferase family protein [Pseudomonadota bacterium]
GQEERYDLDLSGERVYFGTAGAAVHLVDIEKREYRDSTISDLYNAARLVDRMEHIHFFQRSMVPRDLEDPREMDFNTCYASIAGTKKHVGTSFVAPDHANEAIDMLELVAGGERKWRERPFVSCSCCHVVPPLRFAEDACRVLEVCVSRGMPILLLAAGQAGATSPAA